MAAEPSLRPTVSQRPTSADLSRAAEGHAPFYASDIDDHSGTPVRESAIMRMPKTPRPSMNCLALPSTPSLFFVCGAVGEGNSPPSRPSSIMVKSATAQICAERTQQFLVTFSGLAVPSDCADNAEQNRGDQSENEATQPAPHCAGNVRMKLGITWSVSSAPGGNVTAGTINAKGLYISPATLSSPHSVKRKLPIVRFQRQHLKPNPNCVFRFTERRFDREFHNHNRWAQVSKRYEVISMIQTTRAMMSKYCNSCDTGFLD